MMLKLNSDQELKPCPFCGGQVTMKDRYRTIIRCDVCDFELAKWGKDMAISIWNRRA